MAAASTLSQQNDLLGKKLNDLFAKISGISGAFPKNASDLTGDAVKGAFSFAEGMARVNIKAHLDEDSLNDAYNKVFDITRKNKGNIDLAPAALEKIVSQTGDAALAMDILDASMQGAKGGFADIDSLSGALVRSLAAIGKEKAGAQEVMDTFFAASKASSGGIAETARLMPDLIAGASKLGISYKEVGGVFAYMTGQGKSAEQAAALMGDAFGALAQGDVQNAMSKYGVQVLDAQGKMRGMLDIARDISAATAGKGDGEKADILQKMGLKDGDALNAFGLLTADTSQLAVSMEQVANSSGETKAAMEAASTPMQVLMDLYNTFKLHLTELGSKFLPVFSGALLIVESVLTPVFSLIEGVSWIIGDLFGELENGNPMIWGLAAALTGAAVAMNAATLAAQTKLVWDTLCSGATKAWTIAQKALNKAFWANPMTQIVVGIGVLVGAIVWAWNTFEGFRQGVLVCWEILKVFGQTIGDIFGGVGNLVKALYKLFKGDFSGAAEDAKKGYESISSALDPTNFTAKMVMAVETGKAKGSESFAQSQQKKNEEGAAAADPVGLLGTGNPLSVLPSLQMPVSEATTMPQMGDTGTYAYAGGKSISMQKFCDSIVIQIDQANDKGYNQIQQEVEVQLKKMLDEYDA